MKISKLFGIVIGLHFGVIALLIVQPGCTTTSPPTLSITQSERNDPLPESAGMTEDGFGLKEGIDSAFNAGLEPERFEPTRPEGDFNASGTVEPLEPMQSSGSGQFITVEEDTFTSHTVASGDSLWKISRQYKVDLNDLLKLNNLEKEAVLQINQIIKVPTEGSQAAVATISPDVYQPTGLTAETMPYTVQGGDTLTRISRQHGVSVAQIKSANNMASDIIRIGQELMIPVEGAQPVSAVPAETASTTQVTSANANGTHTVQAGENPSSIAQRYGMKSSELLEMNGISDPRRLQIGQVLQVNQAESAAPAVVENQTAPELEAAAEVSAPKVEAVPVDAEGPVKIGVVEAVPVVINEEDPDAAFENVTNVPVVNITNTTE